MKAMAISIFFIFFSFLSLSEVSAIDFDFSSPSEISLNQEFTVSISSSQDGNNYDVKIYVHNSTDIKITQKEIISQILDADKWKDSWYYVISSFPSDFEYKVKVTESGGREICVQLREAGKTSYDKLCKSISIKPQSENSNNNEKDNGNGNPVEEESQVSEDRAGFPNGENNSQVTSRILWQSQENDIYYQNYSNEKIVLNSKSGSRISGEIFSTRQDKARLYAIFAFTIFTIIILILLALKKL